MSSGTAIKAVVIYVSDYITKSSLKTHVIFDSIKSVFHKNGEMIGGTLPMKEKARCVMIKVVNLPSAKMEMGAPMICMYLLDNPDHYTNHTFVPFYWQSYVTEAHSCFEETTLEKHKVALIKHKGCIIGLSPVFDYIYCSAELQNSALYEWIAQFKHVKIPKSGSKSKQQNRDIEPLEDSLSDVFSQSNFSDNDNLDKDFENLSEEECGLVPPKSIEKNMYRYMPSHPLYATHATKSNPDNIKTVSNLIGPPLPQRDQGDHEYYCSTMLTFFKPWHTGNDLKKLNTTWDEEFSKYKFTAQQNQFMQNFNI